MHKPLIGVTTGLNESEEYLTLNRCFMEMISKRGCIPVILPLETDPDRLHELAERFDGFVFNGGGDIDPIYFGEETRPQSGKISPLRDAMEIPLAKMLHHDFRKPVFGICRGMQVMAVALGGSLYQDIAADCGHPVLAHRQKVPQTYPAHSVDIRPDSILHSIIRQDSVRVNSLHHQAVRDLPQVLLPCAISQDRIIEAFESIAHPFYLGVQWHPERLNDGGSASDALFTAFARACGASDC